jgi:hypothetical protein
LTLLGLPSSEDSVPDALLDDSNGIESRQIALELYRSRGEPILLQKIRENLDLDFLTDCAGRVLRHGVANLRIQAPERVALPV